MKNVMKKNKWALIMTSIVILLPIIVGLIVWNDLPQQIATHWGADGKADGFSSRAVAVFLLPLLMLGIHWLCALITCADPGNKGQNERILSMVLWISPILSVIMNGLVYANALGMAVSVSMVTPICMGILFVVIGNYLPKCKRNYTIGIKVSWALENEENWNKTHRFAGKVWVAGGLALIAAGFLPEGLLMIVLFAALGLLVGAPVFYSYFYHKKQVREGNASCDCTGHGDRDDL